jgi:hypothetical protein
MEAAENTRVPTACVGGLGGVADASGLPRGVLEAVDGGFGDAAADVRWVVAEEPVPGVHHPDHRGR